MSDENKNISGIRNQQIAPRHKVNLEGSVLMTAVAQNEDGEEQYLALQGNLLDVSRSGLALIISDEDHCELEALGNKTVLQLLLPLPVQAIELEVVPVRSEQLPQSKNKVLIGAQIVKMSGRDQILFTDFIDQYES